MFEFLTKKKSKEAKVELKVIRADNLSELRDLIKADNFFDAFDIELYYKIKKRKNENSNNKRP